MTARLLALIALLIVSVAIGAYAQEPTVHVEYLMSIPCEDPVTGFSFSPLGLDFDIMGGLCVIDADNSRVLRLSRSLAEMTVFAECPADPAGCEFIDIRSDGGGGFHVTERSQGLLVTLDRWGDPVSYRSIGEGAGGLGGRGGRICVALTISGSLQIMDLDSGTDPIECRTGEDGGNSYPVDCSVVKGERIVVTDAFAKRVLVLGPLGRSVGALEGFDFRSPFGTASMAGGCVFVTDSELGSVAVYDSGGAFIGSFGEGHLEMPTFVACRDDGVICVSDPGKMSVEVFKIEQHPCK